MQWYSIFSSYDDIPLGEPLLVYDGYEYAIREFDPYTLAWRSEHIEEPEGLFTYKFYSRIDKYRPC